MNKFLFSTLVFLSSQFMLADASIAQEGNANRNKEKVTSRVYQLVYGTEEMCNHFSPAKSQQVSAAIEEFEKAYPDLITLLKEPPYFERSKRHMTELIEIASKNPEIANCDGLLAILKQLTSTESGKQAIQETIAELKQK